VQRRGVIFFDDMDLALRDRERTRETDDQAIFLTALDGIAIKEGVVFVFTTNCTLDLIDRAFKRPGRIDVALHFEPPGPDLRRRLIERWHPDLRAALDEEAAIADTEGFSFAEIEELRNLLVMRQADTDAWDWGWALEQFSENRAELRTSIRKKMGFSLHDFQETGAYEENRQRD
jgi:SpoVK/Ycf46/Vps4 family AAA+-type ATPase